MFGSDWPVCNTGGGGNPAGFNTWASIMRSSTSRLESLELFASLWGTTAAKVYKIRPGGSDNRVRIGKDSYPEVQ
jgi:L-rhamnono-1,4-lactonase